jgi:hypothetical protein
LRSLLLLRNLLVPSPLLLIPGCMVPRYLLLLLLLTKFIWPRHSLLLLLLLLRILLFRRCLLLLVLLLLLLELMVPRHMLMGLLLLLEHALYPSTMEEDFSSSFQIFRSWRPLLLLLLLNSRWLLMGMQRPSLLRHLLH